MKGCSVQRRDPSDGRATLLSVSAAGRREFEEREARRSEFLSEICQGWSKGDVEKLTALLKRLNDGLSKHRGETPTNLKPRRRPRRPSPWTSAPRCRWTKAIAPETSSKSPDTVSARLSPWVNAP